MLNTAQSLAIVFLIICGSLAFLWLLRVVWPAEQRRPHNDLIGWNISVLGTTYAVMLGFMLYAVWTKFDGAEENVNAEANALVNVVRIAQGLPLPQSQQIQDLGIQYVEIMLGQEWPAMAQLKVSPASRRVVRQLWSTLMSTPIHNISEQTSFNQAITQVAKMTEHRRLRQLQADENLPGILWTVLIVGAILTIISACLFEIANFNLHIIQVLVLSLLVGLVLVAIADINRPFQGSVHVDPIGFEQARETLNELKAMSR